MPTDEVYALEVARAAAISSAGRAGHLLGTWHPVGDGIEARCMNADCVLRVLTYAGRPNRLMLPCPFTERQRAFLLDE